MAEEEKELDLIDIDVDIKTEKGEGGEEKVTLELAGRVMSAKELGDFIEEKVIEVGNKAKKRCSCLPKSLSGPRSQFVNFLLRLLVGVILFAFSIAMIFAGPEGNETVYWGLLSLSVGYLVPGPKYHKAKAPKEEKNSESEEEEMLEV